MSALLWRCPPCAAENALEQATCEFCGQPRPGEISVPRPIASLIAEALNISAARRAALDAEPGIFERMKHPAHPWPRGNVRKS